MFSSSICRADVRIMSLGVLDDAPNVFLVMNEYCEVEGAASFFFKQVLILSMFFEYFQLLCQLQLSKIDWSYSYQTNTSCPSVCMTIIKGDGHTVGCCS
jgi:hypothetical protein